MEVIEKKGANLPADRGTGWYLRFVKGSGGPGHKWRTFREWLRSYSDTAAGNLVA